MTTNSPFNSNIQNAGYCLSQVSPPQYPNTSITPYVTQEPTVPLSYVNYVVDLQQALRAVNTELVRKDQQLQRHLDQEKAYTDILTLSNERTYILGRNGIPLEIMDAVVETAIHAFPQPPLSEIPFYCVLFNGNNIPLTLSESDFLNDRCLILALGQHRVHVTLQKSFKATAALIRLAISRVLSTRQLPYYGGWLATRIDGFAFCPLEGLSTHQPAGNLRQLSSPITDHSPVAATVATQRVFAIFAACNDKNVHQMLFLWFHMAVLYSLLDQLGYVPPLGLCCFSTDSRCLEYIEAIFTWYGDSAFSLDIAPSEFTKSLLARKDEALLVWDKGRLENSAVNARVLEETLVTRRILWRNKPQQEYLQLQALPTLLSERVSALACMSELISLEVPAGCFDNTAYGNLEEISAAVHDYLKAFIGYTSEHISELRTALKSASSQGFNVDRRLNSSCAKAFAIMNGVSRFVNEFINCTSAPLFDTEFDQRLHELLVQTTEKGDTASLPELFIAVTRRHFRNKILMACPKPQLTNGAVPSVLYDFNTLYFTKNAFDAVCHDLFQSAQLY